MTTAPKPPLFERFGLLVAAPPVASRILVLFCGVHAAHLCDQSIILRLVKVHRRTRIPCNRLARGYSCFSVQRIWQLALEPLAKRIPAVR